MTAVGTRPRYGDARDDGECRGISGLRKFSRLVCAAYHGENSQTNWN
jgi:hypothetical protein